MRLISFRRWNNLGKVGSLPELRTALAIKGGYLGLQSRIESSVNQLSGTAALRAMAHAMRGFALANPGLAAASFRSLDVTSPEWDVSGQALARITSRFFLPAGSMMMRQLAVRS
ncbi:TetR-like C-terminal domain-containing protein [Tardiphaga robiniae]|uniref:TetR-like C-terminal domain-containing protein n=1 Tax=Tardiphaga robiniae TaxID=943830 RepID=UPI001FCEF8B5|nr:TetR-like C-terminal domain-containing protein [Tardiphaga robiniae]